MAPHQTASPLWLGNVCLASVLVLTPRRIWAVLVAMTFTAFVLYDLQRGMAIDSIAWLNLADAAEIFTAVFCLSYFFDGVPQLNSLKALAKFLLAAVILAPLIGAAMGASGRHGDYWTLVRISFFSEALGYLTLMPAILGWFNKGLGWDAKSRAYKLEAAALTVALVGVGYVTFVAMPLSGPPVLLYSLVPFLLWAALRLGPTGVSTAGLVVAFLSIWGVVHGQGPFNGPDPLGDVLSLQLFLFFAVTPFLVLAALVEERKRAEAGLREGEERLLLAIEAGKLGGWGWDVKSGRNLLFGETRALLGMPAADPSGSPQDFWARVHPEDQRKLRKTVAVARRDRAEFDQEFRVAWQDGTERWLRTVGKFFYTAAGEPERLTGILRDVTERKLTLEAVRQREAELKKAQRLANVGSWQWDPDTNKVTWSEELFRIAGRDPGLGAVSYQDHGKLYTPETWERLQRAVEETMNGGPPYELDLEMIRGDGSRRWLVARGEARRNNLGRVVQLVGTVQDITERKRAEEELRDSEEKFRRVFRDAGVGMAIVSLEGQFLAINESFAEFIGYTEEEMLGKTVRSLTHPDDWARFSSRLSQAVVDGDGFRHVPKRCLHKSGKVVSGDCSASLISDAEGKPQYFVAEVQDVTEAKRAEETIRESEQRFRLVANNAPVMIWMSETDKLCSFFNQSWLDFTGRAMEEEMGNGWAAGVHPDDLDHCLRIYTDSFDARVEFEMEYRLRRQDGEYRWVLDYGVPRFAADGAFQGYIGSAIDITDRKLSEEFLLELSGRLIHAHEEERSRIARELHDDLSQQMALLQIGLEQLEMLERGLSPNARQQLREIGQRAAEVSSDIHNLSHRLHPTKLDTLGLVAAVGSHCQELSKQYGLQIQFVHHGIPSTISKDVTLCLYRIGQEALWNVVKHSGVKEAKLEISRIGNEIQLCISDHGAGFDPESTEVKSGIGLVSMRERLRLVGGRLSIVSQPSRGTTVRACVQLSESGVVRAQSDSKVHQATA